MRETMGIWPSCTKTETPNISLKYDLSQRKQYVFGNILQKPWRKLCNIVKTVGVLKNCLSANFLFTQKLFIYNESTSHKKALFNFFTSQIGCEAWQK